MKIVGSSYNQYFGQWMVDVLDYFILKVAIPTLASVLL